MEQKNYEPTIIEIQPNKVKNLEENKIEEAFNSKEQEKCPMENLTFISLAVNYILLVLLIVVLIWLLTK